MAVATCAVVLLLGACGSTEVVGNGDRVIGEIASADTVTNDLVLPQRPGPRTETSYSVPHVQVFVGPVSDVDDELRRRIYLLPGVEERETIVSFAGTSALWLGEDFTFVDVATTLREREFAHLHPDGSLHAVLPVELAKQATTAKWAELHPWVGREDFWDGMVMLYTPQDFEELEVTWQLVVESYNLVTGEDLDPADFR